MLRRLANAIHRTTQADARRCAFVGSGTLIAVAIGVRFLWPIIDQSRQCSGQLTTDLAAFQRLANRFDVRSVYDLTTNDFRNLTDRVTFHRDFGQVKPVDGVALRCIGDWGLCRFEAQWHTAIGEPVGHRLLFAWENNKHRLHRVNAVDGLGTPVVERVTADDETLIRRALLELLARTGHEDQPGEQNAVLLHFASNAVPVWPDGTNEFTIGGYAIPSDIKLSLTDRNRQAVRYSFDPKQRRIHIDDVSDVYELQALDFEKSYPGCRYWVLASLPGFSSDGQSAVVHFRFGPSFHTDWAWFWYDRRDGQWQHKAHRLVHTN